VTTAGPRCPTCGARLRTGAPWCTQCFTAVDTAGDTAGDPAGDPAGETVLVGPAHEPVRTPAVAAVPGPASGGAVGAPAATWPCTLCGGSVPLAEPACGDCGAPFLAEARDTAPLLVLPLVGDPAALSWAGRTGLALTLLLAVLVVCGLLGLIIG